MIEKSPVVPIPAFYGKSELLNLREVTRYCQFLQENGIKTIMSTAGTSQFNLFNDVETHQFGHCLAKSFDGAVIIGVPDLCSYRLKTFLRYCYGVAKQYPGTKASEIIPLLTFPDRYYNDDGIVKYFNEAADFSQLPIMIHGMTLRHGNGGYWDYSPEVISRLANHKNIIGMKEECSTYEKAKHLILNIPDDFITIVAGGSMARFLYLQPYGATTFLSGIGNIYPEIEIGFMSRVLNNNFEDASKYIKNIEDPVFDIMMKDIGWHVGLREALKIRGFAVGQREPFGKELTEGQKHRLRRMLEDVDTYLKRRRSELVNDIFDLSKIIFKKQVGKSTFVGGNK